MREDDLKANIDAQPGDFLIREAYADWLMEHGREEEADFYRWTVEKKRIPPITLSIISGSYGIMCSPPKKDQIVGNGKYRFSFRYNEGRRSA